MEGKKYAIWGAGQELNRLIHYLSPDLPIVKVIDSDVRKQGHEFTYRKIECISPQDIHSDWIVLIAVKDLESQRAIANQLHDLNVEYYTIYDFIEKYQKESIRIYDMNNQPKKKIEEDRIKKYIDCIVPVGICNLKCPYCYLGDNSKKNNKEKHYPSVDYIARALSPWRLGGIALINFCGDGETLLCEELVPIIKNLVKQGHYISIVTNGTITKVVDDIIKLNIDMQHIFFKFSFHYLELKRLNLLDLFVKNVNSVISAGCSISIEITPGDELIPYIEEVKCFSLEKFGALPQISVARDESVREFKILSELPEEKYRQIWSTFDSPMFEFKFAEVGKRRFSNCMAGVWSLQLDIETGDLYKCTHNPWIDNIYQDINRPINLEPVLDKCCLPYCFNCHSYLALGAIEGISTPTYYEIRDRERRDGTHWVNDKMRTIFEQKLYENNKE